MYQAYLIVSNRQYIHVDQISGHLKIFVDVAVWGRYGMFDPVLADQG